MIGETFGDRVRVRAPPGPRRRHPTEDAECAAAAPCLTANPASPDTGWKRSGAILAVHRGTAVNHGGVLSRDAVGGQGASHPTWYSECEVAGHTPRPGVPGHLSRSRSTKERSPAGPCHQRPVSDHDGRRSPAELNPRRRQKTERCGGSCRFGPLAARCARIRCARIRCAQARHMQPRRRHMVGRRPTRPTPSPDRASHRHRYVPNIA